MDIANQIADEILDLNCDEYEELKCISGIVNCSTKLLSEKNLKRKIKLHNIEQKHFDYETHSTHLPGAALCPGHTGAELRLSDPAHPEWR